MKFILVCLVFFFIFQQEAFSQEKPLEKPRKTKPDAKSLEALQKLDDDESDILFKSPSNNKLDSYLAEVKSKASVDKNDNSLRSFYNELVRVYSVINNNVIKSSIINNEAAKKISDLIDRKGASYLFLPVNGGDYLLRGASTKPSLPISVDVRGVDYSISETVSDENWGLYLYEWDKKPLVNLNLVKLESCGPIGAVLYKIDQMGNISPCVISCLNSFKYKEKNFKSFNVSGLESLADGDYFFNEKGNLSGIAYLIKGKTIILDGLFLIEITNELFKTIKGKFSLGVIGSIMAKGFLVKEVLNIDNKILVNDIIEEIDNVKVTSENAYTIKQKFKNKKKIDLKIIRENKQENIKCNLVGEMPIPKISTLINKEYQKILIWIDPVDSIQLTEAIKFMESCKQFGIDTYEIKFYRLNEESLINWLATVKLTSYLLLNKKADALEWLKNNPYLETDEYLIKFNQQFALNKGIAEGILANKDTEEAILEDYTDGLLKHHIITLPSISFTSGNGVPLNQDFESWVRRLFDENGF
jgi:hypothetical protein